MSLNDPRWGRKGSEDDSSQKENEIKEPPKETDEEPRKAEPSRNEMPGRFTQNNNDGDLEELWKQFNDRLNSMLGGTKGNQNRNAQKEEPSASSQAQNQKNEDYDFDEPPLRKDHEFKNQQNSFGNGGGNGCFSHCYRFGRVAGLRLLYRSGRSERRCDHFRTLHRKHECRFPLAPALSDPGRCFSRRFFCS